MSYLEMVSPHFMPTIPQGRKEAVRETRAPKSARTVTESAAHYSANLEFDFGSTDSDETRDCSCGNCTHTGDCVDSVCHPNGTASVHPDDRID